MNNQTSFLIDADLDAVSGGAPISCEGAHALSVFFSALASVS
jgi:hypothetical protein